MAGATRHSGSGAAARYSSHRDPGAAGAGELDRPHGHDAGGDPGRAVPGQPLGRPGQAGPAENGASRAAPAAPAGPLAGSRRTAVPVPGGVPSAAGRAGAASLWRRQPGDGPGQLGSVGPGSTSKSMIPLD